jgi:hypothetical protein
MRYRVVGVLSSNLVEHVEFEGSAQELLERYPRQLFPTPINRWVGDVLASGDTILYRLQGSQSRLSPTWETVHQDPRL